MKTIALFGGSGGLGSLLVPFLEKDYKVISLSSSAVNIKMPAQVRHFFEANEVDIVINASGVNYDTFLHKITSETITNVKDAIDTNIIGNVNIVSCCLPQMRERNYGRVILFSSVLSTRVVPGTSIYSASKSFIDTLVRVASAENASKHITCNSIKLGYFDGGMCHRIPEPYKEDIKNSTGLKRWGTIGELYNTIEFIIQTEYFTGQNISVEGGMR